MTPAARLRRTVALAATGIIAATMTACTAAEPADPGSAGGSSALRVSFATAPASIDPAVGCTGEDRQLTNSLYTRLVDFGTESGPDGTTQVDYEEIVPYLASDWSVSEDGLTYTFELETGWEFPSGEPMDAAAVEYSLERTLSMGQCGAFILHDLYPELIESVEAPDDSTVVITLTMPDPQVLSALADTSGAIVDPSVVEANGGVQENELNDWMASNSAGGGAFVLESYEPGSSAVLTANPTYGGDQPASERIDVTWETSASTQLLNVQNGTTDVVFGMTGTALESLQSDPDVTVVSYDDTQSMVMTLPNDKAPWTDPAIRQAVVEAMPTQDIIDRVIAGYGKAYYGPIPPSMPGYSEENGQPVEQDLEHAKELVAQSGVQTPIAITLDVLAGDQNQESIATIVQGTLQEIGFDVTIRTLTSSAWTDAVYNGTSQAALRFDGPAFANAGYYLQYDADCSAVGSYNTGFICIEENTPLLAEARASDDEAERNELYAEYTANWVAAYPRVTFYQSLTPVALSGEVTDFYFSGSVDMRTWGLS